MEHPPGEAEHARANTPQAHLVGAHHGGEPREVAARVAADGRGVEGEDGRARTVRDQAEEARREGARGASGPLVAVTSLCIYVVFFSFVPVPLYSF